MPGLRCVKAECSRHNVRDQWNRVDAMARPLGVTLPRYSSLEDCNALSRYTTGGYVLVMCAIAECHLVFPKAVARNFALTRHLPV